MYIQDIIECPNRPKIVSDMGSWKIYNKRQGCSQKQIMTVAMSKNNDCYCCNPVDLENNLMFAGLPNHSPLLTMPAECMICNID